jgi:hypothetical protein
MNRTGVRAILVDLIEGRRTPEDVADWGAAEMAALEDMPVSDIAAWDTLATLSGADLLTAPGQYLHGVEDYRAWLEELDAA